ncbi:MAG: hypothetical protein Q9168_002237 [Polycauliona sp. 1 TL-2023]
MTVPLHLSFLRPLPLPTRSSLLLLKAFSSTTPISKGAQQFVNKRPPRPSKKPTAAANNKPPKSSSKTIKPEPTLPIPDITQSLPYHIHRTPSQQLPVYQLAKRGGNLLLTRLRKIDGDITILKEELQQVLGLKQEQISINQLTKHIIIKVRSGAYRDPFVSESAPLTPSRCVGQGWRRNEVNQFLQNRHF